jgi:hypothetical protein
MKDMITITTEHTYTAEALAGFYLARCLSGIIHIDTAAALRCIGEAQDQIKSLFERGGQKAFEAGFVDAVGRSSRMIAEIESVGRRERWQPLISPALPTYSACVEGWKAATGRDFPWGLYQFKAHAAAIAAETK